MLSSCEWHWAQSEKKKITQPSWFPSSMTSNTRTKIQTDGDLSSLRVRINVSWFGKYDSLIIFHDAFIPAWKSRYQNIIQKRKNSCFFNRETKFILLMLLEMSSIRMCHVLWQQICYPCIYTKTERNRSLLFKEITQVVKLLRHWSVC